MATGFERSETIEADEDDEVVEYNKKEYLRVVKLAQERKVVRKGWVENHVIGYCCRCEQEVRFSGSEKRCFCRHQFCGLCLMYSE